MGRGREWKETDKRTCWSEDQSEGTWREAGSLELARRRADLESLKTLRETRLE